MTRAKSKQNTAGVGATGYIKTWWIHPPTVVRATHNDWATKQFMRPSSHWLVMKIELLERADRQSPAISLDQTRFLTQSVEKPRCPRVGIASS